MAKGRIGSWLVLALLSVIAVACNGDATDESTTTSLESTSDASTTTQVDDTSTSVDTTIGGVEPEGTFVIAIEDSPGSLVYYSAPSFSTAMLAGNIYSTLVRTDLDFGFVPDLAETWDVADDGLTYTFNLTQAATWHDGEPVTAEDVAFTWETFIAPQGGDLVSLVDSVDTPDDYTVVFSLSEPYAPMLLSMSDWGGVKIMPEHIYADTGADLEGHPTNSSPIGSGPFKFSQWEEGSFVELVRHDGYHGTPRPYLERLIFQTIPDANARVLALEEGEIDFLHALIVPYDRVQSFRDNPDLNVIEGGLGTGVQEMLLFNLEDEALGDAAVRQAIAYALDRQQLNELAMFSQGTPASSPVPSSQGFHDPSTQALYQHDPARAVELLDEAGFTPDDDGTRLSLTLDIATGRDYEDRLAQIVQEQLGEVGIEVTLNSSDLQSYLERTFVQGDFDLLIQLWSSGPDPAGSVGPRYSEEFLAQPFLNGMRYVNPEIEDILANETSITDVDERREAWFEFQRIILEDLPVVPLVELPNLQIASAEFEGVVTSATTGYISQPRDEVRLVR